MGLVYEKAPLSGEPFDFAKKMGMDTTIMYGYRMNGKKAQLVIFDDIYKERP